MTELEMLNNLWNFATVSPFILIMFVVFGCVWLLRSKILPIWLPKIESNRWFKTFLPIGVIVLAIIMSMILYVIPVFPAIHWAMAIIRGLVAGILLIAGYGFVTNWIREKFADTKRKSSLPPKTK